MTTPVRPPAPFHSRIHHILLVSGVIVGCAHDNHVAPQTATAVAHPAEIIEVEFPWPAKLGPMASNVCAQIVQRVQQGLALEDDVWSAVTCVVDRLVTTDRTSEIDAFLERVHTFEASTTLIFGVDVKQAGTAGLDVSHVREGVVRVYATAAQRRTHPSLGKVTADTLGAGSYRGLCFPWSRKKADFPGHYEVTKSTLNNLRTRGIAISASAEDVMADASQDPDVFEWNEMSAHGQTADAEGVPVQSSSAAEGRWEAWLLKWFGDAGRRCGSTDPLERKRGIYLLGYALHGIQDVASHRGRTNPEHAYNSRHEENPDRISGVDVLATEMATSLLAFALSGVSAACKPLLAETHWGVLLFPEKMVAFHFSWEGNPVALVSYELSASKFTPHAKDANARTRWFGPVGSWPPKQKCAEESACLDLETRVATALCGDNASCLADEKRLKGATP